MTDATTTTDTDLASYLVTEGYKILRIDYSRPRYEYTLDRPITDHELAFLSGNARSRPADLLKISKKLNRIIGKRCQWEED